MNARDSEPAGLQDPAAIFARAAERARSMNLAYAGAVTPAEAHALREAGAATLLDVRTPEEFHHVGHVPGTRLVEWPRAGGPEHIGNFIAAVAGSHDPEAPLLLLCRSGVRSHYAAHVLAQAGFGRAYNILEGFEGPAPGQGWRAAGLPTEQG